MIRILTGGLQTTVQDMGRTGFQASGVPVAGAMDQTALRVGNLLVGNTDACASIEASLIGPALLFERPSLIALSGGDLCATVDDVPLPPWTPAAIPAGATLRFGRPRTGCRAYVAVAGGIDVPPVFGSRSTYLRASFGGHEGRALRAGDVLRTGDPSPLAEALLRAIASADDTLSIARWSIAASLRPRYSEEPIVRLLPGAHTNSLTAESRGVLTSTAMRVASASDRMGYRLEGIELALRAPLELLSEGVTFGTVQLPPSGAPIILMADRQTTGGYPRIGEVASVDLPLVAQLKPGDRLRVRFIGVEEAQQLVVERERLIAQARLAVSLRPRYGPSGAP